MKKTIFQGLIIIFTLGSFGFIYKQNVMQNPDEIGKNLSVSKLSTQNAIIQHEMNDDQWN